MRHALFLHTVWDFCCQYQVSRPVFYHPIEMSGSFHTLALFRSNAQHSSQKQVETGFINFPILWKQITLFQCCNCCNLENYNTIIWDVFFYVQMIANQYYTLSKSIVAWKNQGYLIEWHGNDNGIAIIMPWFDHV